MSRLSQIRDSRSPREAKIKLPKMPEPSRFGGTYLADMLAPDRNSFAIIRMAMALAVLVSHSYWFAFGSIGSQPLVKWTGHSLGEHAVQVFFLLSGILVAQSLHRSGSIVDYVCARALRIFPALLVCVFLTAFVLGPIVTNLSMAEYFKDSRVAAYIVKTLTLSTGSAPLPGVFTDVPLANLVNVSLWTLKFEVLCYIALALLGVAGLMKDRYRVWSAIGLALFVSVVFLRQPLPDAKYTAVDNIRYLMLFFFTGVLAFQARTWLFVHGLIVLPLAAIFAASIGTRFVEISSAVFLGYTMLWISTYSFGPLREFTNKNDYSYGTYIYSGPIQQMIVHFLPGFAPWVVTAFAVGIAVPLAVYSWELIERPALALRQPIRDWILALRGRAANAWAVVMPAQTPSNKPASAFASAFVAAEDAPLAADATVSAEPAPDSTANATDALVTPPRRQRRATLVAPVAPSAVPRRQRHALALKLITVSPEVVAMHQSKAFAEAVAKIRATTKANTAYAPGFDAQRTPYARNWLMSLGWLAHNGKTATDQPATTIQLDDVAVKRQRNRPLVVDAGRRKVAATTPLPEPALLSSAPEANTAKPRLTLRTWLATLTSSRQQKQTTPQPLAEIPGDRLAQALRARTQNRPKWTVPANDTTSVNGSNPLPS